MCYTLCMDLNPELDLPELYEPYPEELLILGTECYQGLQTMTVHRQLERGRYKMICSVKVQDKATKTSRPTYSVEDICELAMKIIQYNVLETDDPGNYKVSFIGPGGKGRVTRSKHIRLNEEQSPRAVNQLDEADLIDAQMEYITQLQGSNLTLMEIVSGMVAPLLQQNQDLSKTVTDSVSRIAEVEALRMAHDLQMRQIEDENRQEIARQNMEQERWSELFGHVKNTGAVEALLAGLMKKFGPGSDKKKKPKKDDGEVINAESRFRGKRPPHPGPSEKDAASDAFPDARQLAESVRQAEVGMVKVQNDLATTNKDAEKSKANEKPKPDQDPYSENKKEDETVEAEVVDMEEEQDRLEEHARKMMEESPLVFVAQSLKQSIDQRKQWKVIYKILSPEQVDIFDAITAAKTDEEVMEALDRLKSTEPHKLLMLRAKMVDEQQKFVDVLLNAAVSGEYPFTDEDEE